MERNQTIAGYNYGGSDVAKSPITVQEWEELKKSALFSEEDVIYLRLSGDILADQIEFAKAISERRTVYSGWIPAAAIALP